MTFQQAQGTGSCTRSGESTASTFDIDKARENVRQVLLEPLQGWFGGMLSGGAGVVRSPGFYISTLESYFSNSSHREVLAKAAQDARVALRALPTNLVRNAACADSRLASLVAPLRDPDPDPVRGDLVTCLVFLATQEN